MPASPRCLTLLPPESCFADPLGAFHWALKRGQNAVLTHPEHRAGPQNLTQRTGRPAIRNPKITPTVIKCSPQVGSDSQMCFVWLHHVFNYFKNVLPPFRHQMSYKKKKIPISSLHSCMTTFLRAVAYLSLLSPGAHLPTLFHLPTVFHVLPPPVPRAQQTCSHGVPALPCPVPQQPSAICRW